MSWFARAILLLCLAAYFPARASGENYEQKAELVPAAMSAPEKGLLFEATGYYNAGKRTDAERVLAGMVSKYPDNYQGLYLYSAVLAQLGKDKAARDVFESLFKLEPGDYRLLNNFAWLLATSKDSEIRDPARALELAQEAILRAPDNSSVWNTLAEAHYINGNFERARRSMEHSLELASREPEAAPKLEEYQAQLAKMRQAEQVMQLLE